MKRKLVISTGNLHKVEEIRNILGDLEIEVLSKKDIGFQSLDVVENGDTLEANSIKKARALAAEVDYLVMADDSGLFVDVLDGSPGVYSSRYAGEEGNDKKNNEKLLMELSSIPRENRDAKFKTVISIITEDKREIIVHGECKGKIGFEENGKDGFGYDPLFIPDGYSETFAQIGEEEKNKISHRAKALENLKMEISKLVRMEER